MQVRSKVRSAAGVRLFALVILIAVASGLVFQTSISQSKMPETIVLSKEYKPGPVPFDHLKHATENRSADLSMPIACIDCHHVAQPAAAAAKRPPHKTAWPADRTTTLTMDLMETDPNTLVAKCSDCHARAGQKPKLLTEIPTVTLADASKPTVMNNEQAFHRQCGDCHDAVAKIKPDTTGPTSNKCTTCHKKSV